MSVRTKFTLGIVFFFLIILLLFLFSAFQFSKLSKRTSAILTENQLSVVCAREMSESVAAINYELTVGFAGKKLPDKQAIEKALDQFSKSLAIEKSNITEVGEDKLASAIEADYRRFRNSTSEILKTSDFANSILEFQQICFGLDEKLMLLSKMNEKAIEIKTDSAKIYAARARTQMAVLGTFCFLLALTFTYNFATYFNERFTQLHNGIKEIVSSNFGQRLHFDGKDEFSEIALVFNKMAENLSTGIVPVQSSVSHQENIGKETDIEELERALIRIQEIEEEVLNLISEYKLKKTF